MTTRLLTVFAVLLCAACAGSVPEAPAPEAARVYEVDAPAPVGAIDNGDDGASVPEAARVAMEAVSLRGHKLHCAATGVADGAWHSDGAIGGIVEGQIVAGTGPATGSATLWREGQPLGTLSWTDAPDGRWGTCHFHTRATYEITGRVLDAQGAAVEGALAGGCLQGRTALTDVHGSFRLDGLLGSVCALYVAHDDGESLRAAGPIEVEGTGADILLAVTLEAARKGGERDAWFASLPTVQKSVETALAQGRALRAEAAQSLEAPARTLAQAWLELEATNPRGAGASPATTALGRAFEGLGR